MRTRFWPVLLCWMVLGVCCTGCGGADFPVLERPGVSQISRQPGLFRPSLADPVWSPDGRRIAATNQIGGGVGTPVGKIYILDVPSGRMSLFMEARNAHRRALSWSPDGKMLAFSTTFGTFAAGDDQGIWIIHVDGSTEPRFLGGGYLAAWSPNGEQIAIGELARGMPGASIWILDLASGDKQRVFSSSDGGFGWGLSWSPDGTRLAFAFGRGLVTGEGTYRDLYVLDLATGALDQLTDREEWDCPTWSPDGRMIAYSAKSKRLNDMLVISRADGSCHVRALEPAEKEIWSISCPAWSPDGATIAFSNWGTLYLLDIAAVLGEDFLVTGPVCP